MALTTVEAVKQLLGLSGVNAARDAALQAVLVAVDVSLLTLTGYVIDAAITGRVDTLEHIREGLAFQMPKRPITGTPVVEGRVLGPDATWTTLTGDVLDPQKGRLLVLGASPYFPSPRAFPPMAMPLAVFRWRAPIWPVIRVTYDVAKTDPVPASLTQAATMMTAYYWSRGGPGGGALQQVQVLGVSETYATNPLPVPPGVSGMIADHLLPATTVKVLV